MHFSITTLTFVLCTALVSAAPAPADLKSAARGLEANEVMSTQDIGKRTCDWNCFATCTDYSQCYTQFCGGDPAACNIYTGTCVAVCGAQCGGC